MDATRSSRNGEYVAIPDDGDASAAMRAKQRERNEWTSAKFVAYGVGHVLNDMCASTWFSYLLVFLRQVASMSPVDSAIVMFAGQIADGVATPLVGVLSDFSNGIPSIGFGRRKTWLAGGSLMVIVCFFFVFAECAPRWFTDTPSRIVMVVYYAVAASLFNFGWAAVQVSHMALVPELSTDDNVRCVLNSTRYAFTILSNVLVFCVFFLLLRTVKPYNVPDETKFTLLAYTSLIIGGAATLLFLVGTHEKLSISTSERRESSNVITQSPPMANTKERGPNTLPFDGDAEVYEMSHMEITASVASSSSTSTMTWRSWFKIGMFYEVGVVYMCTRLVVNVTQVFISFYLIVTLKMSATSIAIVPLLVYVSGFLATFFMRYLNEVWGRTGSFTLGSALVVLSLAFCYVLTPETATWIYAFSIVLGMGNSIIMVTSVCLEGDLVGNNVESGAFVYGAMSFTDKISNGIAILLIQNEREKLQALPEEDAEFLRQVYCVLPSLAALLGVATVMYMRYFSSSKRRSDTNGSSETESLLSLEEQRAVV
uniref:Major facilitator superfamily (MFS) profile domain-containing protein n=1 Tax=Globisporangium ultimum (strain ATCC 200006 / CBS 805.95 / DAOM BR144) TaxID=431595 RepID=K3W7M1_GLOUD